MITVDWQKHKEEACRHLHAQTIDIHSSKKGNNDENDDDDNTTNNNRRRRRRNQDCLLFFGEESLALVVKHSKGVPDGVLWVCACLWQDQQ